MNLNRLFKRLWALFFASAAYEQDTGFRDVVLRLCRKGMVVAGTIGIIGAISNIGAYASAGWVIDFVYDNPKNIVLWDRLIVIVICIAYLVLGRTRSGPRWARPLGALVVLVIGLTVLIDDFFQGFYEADEGFHSDRYLSIAMLIIIAAIPYPPRQALSYFSAIWGVYLLSYWGLSALLGREMAGLSPGFYVYAVLVLVACTGISGLLYHSRYEQYKAQRRAELLKERVKEQAEKLVELERMKARFFVNVSHEFRTPLTLILGPLQDLLDGHSKPDQLTRQAPFMHRNARRLLRLINQLLDLARLDGGGMHLHAQPTNLAPFIHSLVLTFVGRAEREHLTLLFESNSDDIVQCYVDRHKLEHIVTNLLSNAFKFTPAGGKIQVEVASVNDETGPWCTITVADTGQGIPQEELIHVFERFYQIDHPTTRSYESTGIGLALTKELVALHKGEITVESKIGFGTTFTVRLRQGTDHLSPGDIVSEEEVDEDRAWPESEAGIETPTLQPDPDHELLETDEAPRKHTILVIEDNPDMRAYLRSQLETTYHILEAADGEAGLAKTRREKPDLIILDVIMPGMDGYTLCRMLKQDEALNHIPVVLLTARADEASTLEGLGLGADDYVTKPFSAEELLLRAENLIEVRRLLQARFAGSVTIGPSEIVVPSAEAAWLEQVRDVVEAHLDNTAFGVEWLAAEVNMSTRQLQRKIKAVTGLSPRGYIRTLRLERAEQLLTQHWGTVQEVAYAVGYTDAEYFTKIFRQAFGVVPSAYVKRTQTDD